MRAGPGSYVTISERGNTSSQTYLWCEHSLQKVKVKRGKYYYWLTCGVSTHYRKWKWRGGYIITDLLVVRAGPGSYVTISERGNKSSQTYLWCEHWLQKVKVKREKYYYWLTCGVSTHYRKWKWRGGYIITDLLVVRAGPGSYVTISERGNTSSQTYLWCEHWLQKVKVKREKYYYWLTCGVSTHYRKWKWRGGYIITDLLVVRAGPGSYVTISERGNTSSQTYLWCEHSLQKVKVKREKYYYWLTCGVST